MCLYSQTVNTFGFNQRVFYSVEVNSIQRGINYTRYWEQVNVECPSLNMHLLLASRNIAKEDRKARRQGEVMQNAIFCVRYSHCKYKFITMMTMLSLHKTGSTNSRKDWRRDWGGSVSHFWIAFYMGKQSKCLQQLLRSPGYSKLSPWGMYWGRREMRVSEIRGG